MAVVQWRRGHRLLTKPAFVCWLSVSLVTSCTAQQASQSASGTILPSDASCAKSTAVGRTDPNDGKDHGTGVGGPNATRVGPLTIHPYPYQPGYPVKVIIHRVATLDAPLSLRGWRCVDQRPLRFWYRDTDLPIGIPASDHDLRRIGDFG